MRRGLTPFALLLLSPPVGAQTMQGKVVMPDGSPPRQRVWIERACPGNAPFQESLTGKNGEYFWKAAVDDMSVQLYSRQSIPVRCVLRARIKGMASNEIDLSDRRLYSNLQLPTLVLRSEATPPPAPKLAPEPAKKWQAALAAHRAENWAEAERLARDVVRASPDFGPAWNLVGLALAAEKKPSEAREAFLRALSADPSALVPRFELARAEIELQLWSEASRTTEEVIRLDTTGRYPDAEYAHGVARYMLRDAEGARASWLRYLERSPASRNSAVARARLEELKRPAPVQDPQAPLAVQLEDEPAFAGGIQAWAPGGRRALAAAAGLPATPPADSFFLEYCRAIATQTSRMTAHHVSGYLPRLRAYLDAVSALTDLGERTGDRVRLKLSPGEEKTARVLALLGPSEARALGLERLAIDEALDAGRPFDIEIVFETAAVAGGAAWNTVLRGLPELSGGIAEAFAREPRLARAYVGLAAMPPEIAADLVKRVGWRAVASTHAAALGLYGGAFRAEVPGGPPAEPVWTKLAGVSPREPARFFEALLTVDRGRLAAFYAALAGAAGDRQRFFTASLERAQRFYHWYRESGELREGVGVNPPGWEIDVFRRLPLDRLADSLDGLEAAVRISDLEQRRGAALDAESARLLARNFDAWRALFPYFEALPRLGADAFRALEAFSSAPRDEAALAAWHAAAALILLGRNAGSLDDDAAARAFARLCRSGGALATLHEIVRAGADLDEAVPAELLRLTGARRAAFDRVRVLQRAPRIGASSNAALSLSGAVYAATLDPDGLLVNEDRDLLRKHVFAPHLPALFSETVLARSHFEGGFMTFATAARGLAYGGRPTVSEADRSSDGGSGATFRASARLVEVHAAITDEHGRPLDGLHRDQFAILDNGHAVPVTAFENQASGLSCVLLLDTSQSMDSSLEALKSAALKLIGGLRPDDAVAVYSLTGGITELQPFTTDKKAARRAVERAELGEFTALYDGLVRVNRDLAGRTGKKVIVVFTDGEDNASALGAAHATRRAKTAGVPIYTIAQGQAIRNAALMRELRELSQATGGMSFAIRSAAGIGPVFESVLQDLLHGYLLAFPAASVEDREWRRIDVKLRAPGKVRAREGYYPE